MGALSKASLLTVLRGQISKVIQTDDAAAFFILMENQPP